MDSARPRPVLTHLPRSPVSYDPHQQPYVHRADQHAGYPQQYGQLVPDHEWQADPPPPLPAPRQAKWPYAVLAAAVLFLAGGVWTAYDRGVIFKDSGIEACEGFRDGKKTEGAPVDAKAGERMTEAQYLELREFFQDSRHDDLRQAGTKLVDVMWQVMQLGTDPGIEALPLVGQMATAATNMQGACANHGIVINILKDAKQSN